MSCFTFLRNSFRFGALSPLYWRILVAQFTNSLMAPLWVFVFFDTTVPVFSPSTSLSTRSLCYGLALGLSYWLGMLSNLILGIVSDLYGRIRLWEITVIGFVLTAGLVLWAQAHHSPVWVIIAMVILGSSFMALQAGIAMIGEQGPPDTRLRDMAILQCMVSLGAAIGPWLGGMLAISTFLVPHPYTWPYVLVMLCGVGLAVSLRTRRSKVLFVKSHVLTSPLSSANHATFESNPNRADSAKQGWIQALSDFMRIFHFPEARRCFLILILCQLSWAAYYEFSPAILKLSFGATPAWVGHFQAAIALWLFLASGLILHVFKRWMSLKTLIQISCLGLLLGVVFALIAGGFPHDIWAKRLLWISAIPTAVGDVMLYSIVITRLSEVLPPSFQGKVMGCVYVMIGVSWSFSGLLGGALLAKFSNGPFFYAPVSALILMILVMNAQWIRALVGEKNRGEY